MQVVSRAHTVFRKKWRTPFGKCPPLVNLICLKPSSMPVITTELGLSFRRLTSKSLFRAGFEFRLPCGKAGHHLSTCHTPNSA